MRARVRVGCCGWNRIGLVVPKEDREGASLLESYARIFDSVEINSSFYQYHREATYRAWRQTVGPKFSFTIKAHKDITHVHRLAVNKQVLDCIERMSEACRAIGAEVLLLQTPASLCHSQESIAAAKDLLENLKIPKVRVAWETRGQSWSTPQARSDLAKLLCEQGATHAVDIFKERPAHVEGFFYFRLHGLGKRMYDYKYSEDDLRRLMELSRPYLKDGGYIFFNNYEMYDDARRFLGMLRPSGAGP